MATGRIAAHIVIGSRTARHRKATWLYYSNYNVVHAGRAWCLPEPCPCLFERL